MFIANGATGAEVRRDGRITDAIRIRCVRIDWDVLGRPTAADQGIPV